MRVLTVGVLCAAFLMSGCTRQQVNDVSVIDCRASDDVPMLMLKTAGNFVPWVGEFIFLVFLAAPELFLRTLAASSRK